MFLWAVHGVFLPGISKSIQTHTRVTTEASTIVFEKGDNLAALFVVVLVDKTQTRALGFQINGQARRGI